jgi:hypothetical protein
VKGNDGGRISANIPRTVWGRELFGRKHWDKLVRSGTLYLFLRESGWWQQRRVRDAREARRFYLESLRANALAPVTYILLLASYLPLSWLDCTAHSARRLSSAAVRVRDMVSSSAVWRQAATLRGTLTRDSAASDVSRAHFAGVFLSLAGGGAERAMVNLAAGFSTRRQTFRARQRDSPTSVVAAGCPRGRPQSPRVCCGRCSLVAYLGRERPGRCCRRSTTPAWRDDRLAHVISQNPQ